MGGYENLVKIEEIKKKVEDGDLQTAQKILDTMEIKRIKNILDMNLLADVYEANGRYEEAKDLYLSIYEKARSRKSLFKLINILIKLNDAQEAEYYFEKYEAITPDDFYNYIFRYYIEKIKGGTYESLVAILEELKRKEYIEKWAYELAKLYYKAGMERECVRECTDIALWFGEGSYVEKAKILRSYYTGGADKEWIIRELKRRSNETRDQAAYRKAEDNTYSDYNATDEGSYYNEEAAFNEQGNEEYDAEGYAYTDRQGYAGYNAPTEGAYGEQGYEGYNAEEYAYTDQQGYAGYNAPTEGAYGEQGYEEYDAEEYAYTDQQGYAGYNAPTEGAYGEQGYEEYDAEGYAYTDQQGYAGHNAPTEGAYGEQGYEEYDAQGYAYTDQQGYAGHNTPTEETYSEQEYTGYGSEAYAENNDHFGDEFKVNVQDYIDEPEDSRPAEKVYNYEAADEQFVAENQLYEFADDRQEDYDIFSWLEKEYDFNAQDVFEEFLQEETVRSQLVSCMENILADESGNVIMLITGSTATRITSLAKKMAVFLNWVDRLQSSKLAKINADKLNKISIFTKKDVIKDCCLLIENASKLTERTIDNVLELSRELPSAIAVIFADNVNNLNMLFNKYPNLSDVIQNEIHLDL